MGTSEQAQLFKIENGVKKTFQWLLEEKEDSLGNKVSFSYVKNEQQIYLSSINYSIYSIQLSYETRPDPVLNATAGFLVKTNWRCEKIELHLKNSTQPLLRRWEMSYKDNFKIWGHSLLSQVILKGFDETGNVEQIPALDLNYTRFKPRRLRKFDAIDSSTAPGGFQNGTRDLIDWTGNGLPDLIELSNGGGRIWENLGNAKWKRPRQLEDLPMPVTLNQPGIAFDSPAKVKSCSISPFIK